MEEKKNSNDTAKKLMSPVLSWTIIGAEAAAVLVTLIVMIAAC